MPVITVAGPAHPSVGRLLIDVAEAAASTLGLGDGDVIAVHTATGASAKSGADAPADASAWHIVTVQGSYRGRDKMEATLRAAEESVRSWCRQHGIDCEGVWTQWQTPLPG